MELPYQSVSKKLDALEREEDVKIVLAVESGSRAWGFPSADSDFDVRFVYVRRREWYLSIDNGRDVIERPLDDEEIDLSGWDLRKALGLFRKSNPPLLEWLDSPILYREVFATAAELRALIPTVYSPTACLHHYLSMATGNFREYLQGDVVRVKKYFYVLRPVLSCLWIEGSREAVPMEFGKVLERALPGGEVRQAIDNLLEKKRSGAELESGEKIQVLNDWLEREIQRLSTSVRVPKQGHDPTAELNALFRRAIDEVWG